MFRDHCNDRNLFFIFLHSGVRECEERIRNGKDTLTRFAIRERKFSERETSLLTGTITPAGRMKSSKMQCNIFIGK